MKVWVVESGSTDQYDPTSDVTGVFADRKAVEKHCAELVGSVKLTETLHAGSEVIGLFADNEDEEIPGHGTWVSARLWEVK